MDSKKKIIFGIILIVVSFLFIASIFYVLVNVQAQKESQLEKLREEMKVLSAEASVAKTKAGELESEIGKTLYLKNFLQEAEQKYGPEERSRKEGRLWIDRKNKVIVVTLGVINGAYPGTRLAVYDDEKKVGEVKVDIPMDVISYVQPEEFLLNQFEKDYYRVVIE